MIRKLFLYLGLCGLASAVLGATAPALPLSGADIGNPAQAGATTRAAEGWSLVAGGTDIWGASDQFHYANQPRTGDFDVAVQIRELTPANLYSKVGLMVRENLAGGSRHLYFMVFADNQPRHNNNGGYEFQFREAMGGKSQATYPTIAAGAPPEFPVAYPNVWLRLRRHGDEFTAFASADGKNWKPYTTHTLPLPANVFLGVALVSHNAKATATAQCGDLVDVK